jgi:hypothetical protein
MDHAAIRAFTALALLAAATTGAAADPIFNSVTGINDNGHVRVLATNSNPDFRSYLLASSGLPLPTAPNPTLVLAPVTIGPYATPGAPVPEPSASPIFVVVIAALGARRYAGQGWVLTERASRVRGRGACSKAWFHKALTLMRHGGNHHHQ